MNSQTIIKPNPPRIVVNKATVNLLNKCIKKGSTHYWSFQIAANLGMN